MKALIVLVGLAGAASGPWDVALSAQDAPTTEGPRRTFEVASVRPSGSAERRATPVSAGDRFVVANFTLRQLIQFAYALPPVQIVGGPAWIEVERFDVDAKADKPLSPDEMRPLVRELLAERFGLKAAFERRDTPVYALVIPASGHKPGPGLGKPAFDCASVRAGRGTPPLRADGSSRCSTRMGSGGFSGADVPIARFVAALQPFLDRLVVDRTGLTGTFDIELQWAPTFPRGGVPLETPVQDDRPSLFTAVQERLGLRLEPRLDAIEILVIRDARLPAPQ